MEKRFTITPHPDIELNIKRQELEYFLTYPDSGINESTGLILFISGYGDTASSEYQSRKLRPYLANKYNCIVGGVNYHGIWLRTPNAYMDVETGSQQRFPLRVEKVFGIKPEQYIVSGIVQLPVLASLLINKGIRSLTEDCAIFFKSKKDEYQSFGFLPALDHLAVLGDILRKHSINKRKIMLFGTSYGGYVSLLLGKIAGNTFSLIVDNSGFVKIEIGNLVGHEMTGLEHNVLLINGVSFPYLLVNPWTIMDEMSPYYFSDSHRCIRSLLRSDHFAETETRYYVFHSIKDKVVPIAHKDQFVDILKSKNVKVNYKRIREEDIDGKIFKTMEHGMNVSLRGVFDLVALLDGNAFSRDDSLTDFDLESNNVFECNGKTYTFQFNRNYNFAVTMKNENSLAV